MTAPLRTLKAESTDSEEISTEAFDSFLKPSCNSSPPSVLVSVQCVCRGGGGGVGLTGTAGFGGNAGFPTVKSGVPIGVERFCGDGDSPFWSRRMPCYEFTILNYLKKF